MFKGRNWLLLIVLFAVAFTLRVYKLENIPSGAHADEASWGYNAYSILKTGKDEHGVRYPLIFKAFGDQKLPAYIYSLVPSVKLFGLNNFAVRFPSVLAGSLLTIFIFMLLLQFGFSMPLSFLGALTAAVSPWNISLSRLFGHDSNLALLFFMIGLFFALKSVKARKVFPFVVSGVFLGLTWYSYVAYRFITPITMIVFSIVYLRQEKNIKRYLVALFGTFFIVVFPLTILSFSGQGTARFGQISLTQQVGKVLEINESRTFCTDNLPKIFCYLNANKIESISSALVYRYVRTFSPTYLFLDGDNNSKFHNVNNYGLFYLMLLPFYLAGFVYFSNRLFNGKLNKHEAFVLLGLILSPLPAVLVDETQKIRLSGLFPFLIAFITYGIAQTYEYLKKFLNAKIYYFIIIFATIIFTAAFMINFTAVHVARYESSFGNYIPKLMRYIDGQNKETQIYIRSITEGIMYYSYFTKVDPVVFQKSVVRQVPDAIGFVHATDLGNIHITNNNIYEIYCRNKDKNNKVLYVASENLIKVGEINRAEQIIWSENGVDTLALVYNVKDISKPDLDCSLLMK